MRDPIVPPMLADIIQNALLSVEGTTYGDLLKCPFCGGGVQQHDIRKKRFAVVRQRGGHHTIYVQVRRYYCKECHQLCYANAPFYPDIRIGAPVVDFCYLNLRDYPYNRLSRILELIGVIVHRGTIRNWANLNLGSVPFLKLFGYNIPLSLLNLSDEHSPESLLLSVLSGPKK